MPRPQITEGELRLPLDLIPIEALSSILFNVLDQEDLSEVEEAAMQRFALQLEAEIDRRMKK